MAIKLLELTKNSHHQINQFTLIWYGFGVRCDVDIFKLAARAQYIYREIYEYIYIYLSIFIMKFYSSTDQDV